MDDLIPRAAARDVINTWGRHENENVRMDLLHNDMNAIPAVDAIPVAWLEELHRKAYAEEAADTDLMDLIMDIINIWHYEQGRENDEQR